MLGKKDKIQLKQTGSYYNQKEWLKKFLDGNVAFCNDSENDDENYNENIEAVVRRCSSKEPFVKVSQISLENTCVEVSATVLKIDSNTGVFL